MPTDATSCSGWDCTIEGQFCPKGLPGASSYAYTCGYPETSELNDHLTAGNLHWIARGDTRPSCKSFDYYKESQDCSLSLQAAGKDGVPALSTYTDNPYDYYESRLKNTNITVNECKAVCAGDTQCKSFDYNKETSRCDINYKAAGKDGAPGLSSYPGKWDYYELSNGEERWDYYERDSGYEEFVPGFQEHTMKWRGTVDRPYAQSRFFCDPSLNGADCYGPSATCDQTQDSVIDWALALGTFGISEIPGVNLSETLYPFYGKVGVCDDGEWDERLPSNFAHDRGGPDKDGCTIQPMGACNHSGSLESGDDGCCKDYTAEGGENYFCRDSGKLFSTDYRCRKPEEE